jgi:IclR family pca regulon transcriptional regulator
VTRQKSVVRTTSSVRAANPAKRGGAQKSGGALVVASVEKAFRVLEAFGGRRQTLSLSQVAAATGMDISAAQRFTHTLTHLGYLRKDTETKRYELTPKNLNQGFRFLLGHSLIERAMPYLLHLSTETEEAVSLTVLDDTDIIFVARFMSRHMLNTNVIVGTHLPAYCTAPGIAMLSHLPEAEALAIIDRSDLQPHTPATTWHRNDLTAKLRQSAKQGFATAFGEFYKGDLSVAAAILDERRRPEGAISVGVSFARYKQEEVAGRFGPLVIAAAHSVSRV